jgi:hypothetical protein
LIRVEAKACKELESPATQGFFLSWHLFCYLPAKIFMKTLHILCLFSFIFLSQVLMAQTSGRIQVGLNLSNISNTPGGRVNDANTLRTLQAGVIGDFQLGGPLYLQPGLIYTGKGSKVQSGTEGMNGYFQQTFNPYYLDIPVNLVFKTPASGMGRFFAGAGPYLAVGIRGKTRTEGRTLLGINYNLERDIQFSKDDPSTLTEEEGAGFGIIKRFDYGLNAVAGFEGKSMVLSAGYGLGLAKIQSGAGSGSDDQNKYRVISFSLGFKF